MRDTARRLRWNVQTAILWSTKGMTDCTDSPYTWPKTGEDHTIHPSYSVIPAHPELIVWYRITSACIVYDSSL
jgi:hypothetical protein